MDANLAGDHTRAVHTGKCLGGLMVIHLVISLTPALTQPNELEAPNPNYNVNQGYKELYTLAF